MHTDILNKSRDIFVHQHIYNEDQAKVKWEIEFSQEEILSTKQK
jgi:hypothetical protein